MLMLMTITWGVKADDGNFREEEEEEEGKDVKK